MGVFKRIKDITLSNLNALIDKAEDPVKMTDQYLRDMAEDIKDAESAVAQQIALEKRLKQKLDETQEMIDRRLTQANQALDQNNEELALRALEDKKIHEATYVELEPQWKSAEASSNVLKANLQEMKDQYNSLKAKRDTLAARHDAAKAQKNINAAMSSFNPDGARSGIDRMNEKVAQMEAEAQAGQELRGSTKSLDDEFKALNRNSGAASELEALKAARAAKQ